jgi:hypothetical protein
MPDLAENPEPTGEAGFTSGMTGIGGHAAKVARLFRAPWRANSNFGIIPNHDGMVPNHTEI